MGSDHASCPGLACFELLGRKWTPQIVWALLDGPRRFSVLLAAVPGLSDKMLSRRLRELGAAGVVSRRQYAEIPPRVEYTLTPAGSGLRQVIAEMERWSGEHAPAAVRAEPGLPSPAEARASAVDSRI